MKVQTIFTKIRNVLNEKEDQLLNDIDEQYNNIYFKEELIKESEKLPNNIRDKDSEKNEFGYDVESIKEEEQKMKEEVENNIKAYKEKRNPKEKIEEKTNKNRRIKKNL